MSDQRWPSAILEREWSAYARLVRLRALGQHRTNRWQLRWTNNSTNNSLSLSLSLSLSHRPTHCICLFCSQNLQSQTQAKNRPRGKGEIGGSNALLPNKIWSIMEYYTILSYLQPWNTRFIIHWINGIFIGCYFHNVKISIVWFSQCEKKIMTMM